MRRIAGIILFTFTLPLLAGMAQAQAPSRVNVFAGYSYFNSNLSSLGRASTYGWEGSGEVKLYRWISFVGDLDTHYGSEAFPICQVFPGSGLVCSTFKANFTERNFLTGPRISYAIGNIRPFAQVLVGGSHVNAGDFAGSDNSFTAGAGGGVDFNVTRHFGWRLQADYLRTRFFSTRQDNFRVSTGLVYKF